MIRLFIHLCRTFHKVKHLDDCQLYTALLKKEFPFHSLSSRCPCCMALSSKYRKNGSYSRMLVSYDRTMVQESLLRIPSIRCSSCGHSHALLPSLLVPCSAFSLKFLLSLLYSWLTGKFPSVSSLCFHFRLSESTFYRIRRRFLQDAFLFLPLLNTLPDNPSFPFHSALRSFFLSTGHSFLQPGSTFRQRTLPKPSPPCINRFLDSVLSLLPVVP